MAWQLTESEQAVWDRARTDEAKEAIIAALGYEIPDAVDSLKARFEVAILQAARDELAAEGRIEDV